MNLWTYQGKLSRGLFLIALVSHFALGALFEDFLLPAIGYGVNPIEVFGAYVPGKLVTILGCGFVILFSLHFFIVRRLRDADHKGVWGWGLLFPLVNLYVLYVLIFVESTNTKKAISQ